MAERTLQTYPSPIDAYSSALDRPLIYVGATTVTTALSAVKVESDFTGLTTTYHIANWFISKYTVDGTGSLRTVVGQVDLSGTQTTQTTAQQLVGVHGRAKVSGTAYNASLFVAGVMGQILDGGTWTGANHVTALWGDWQLNETLSGISHTELLYLTNNANNATNNPTTVMYIYAPYMTYLFTLDGLAGTQMVSANTVADATFANWHSIKVYIDGAVHYLIAATTIS